MTALSEIKKKQKTLEDIDVDNAFQNRTSVAQKIGKRIEKWSYIKLKCFCIAKEKAPESKEYLQNGKKSLQVIHWINIQHI
jgi:hypothetical protein